MATIAKCAYCGEKYERDYGYHRVCSYACAVYLKTSEDMERARLDAQRRAEIAVVDAERELLLQAETVADEMRRSRPLVDAEIQLILKADALREARLNFRRAMFRDNVSLL